MTVRNEDRDTAVLRAAEAIQGPAYGKASLEKAAMRYQPDIVLVQGGARGADTIAAVIWRVFGGEVETHRADWDQHGNGAGHIRNKAMVDLGADECLAFIRNQSPGATGCAALAEKAGIPTERWTQP